MTHDDKEYAGRRLAAALLDDLSKRAPERRFGLIPNSQKVSDGFREVTIGDLAQAVNYTSWWIEKTLSRKTKSQTVSYMAANDIRYGIFVLACNKTGYNALLPSMRNSDEAFLHLLKSTDCHTIVYGAERKTRVLDLRRLRPDIQFVEIPSLSEMMAVEIIAYPYETTFEEQENKISFIIHSSGTTGLPKPIVLTHGFVGVFDKIISIPLPPDRRHSHWNSLAPGDLLLSTTPFFHIMGYLSILESLFHNIPFVIPPDKPLSLDLITDVMDATNPTAAMFPPSLLEDMSQSDRAVNAISCLKQLHVGGAPLAPEIGDRISKVTKLVTMIGSSECGLFPTMQPLTSEDWKYYEWNPHSGINLQPIGGDMYELVISKLPSREFQGIFHTFPELQEYRTKDVFIRHPTKPNKWTYHGRLDDVIVLSNGEKFNPVTAEKVIEGHPLVSRAVITGKGRFQTALLVEPNWDKWNEERSASELVDAIWSVVQQANAISAAYGRVAKSMIGLASKGKPFKITAKGSSQRNHIYKDYEEEINAIYRKSHADEDSMFQLTDKADLSKIKDNIKNVVSSLLGRPGLDEKEDFYAAGLDSLQTVQLTRILQGAIQVRCSDKESEVVTPQKVYSNPTTEQLSLLIHTIISGEVVNRFGDGRSRAEKIDSLVTMYTADIPTRELDLQNVPAGGTHSVILTGSTGSLGNYLLAELLRDPQYAKVYCLNRSQNAASRQKASFIEKGLQWDSILEAKVEFLQVSFGSKEFGLDHSKYDEMLRSVDTIIHNAWKVDFNQSIASFENTHIRGMRHFVDFSLQSIHHAHIHFVSSIATVGGWKPKYGLVVPEAPVENPDVTLPQGYGESKHVAERICLAVSRCAGVPTTILRVGQIAGPTLEKGLWNRQEWLPTIIATSKAMGKIPSDLGTTSVDWIPVDTLATIFLELIETRRRTQSETRSAAFNLINPSVTSWASLLPAVRKHYSVETVDLASWVHELEQTRDLSEEEVVARPALKLVDFYRNLLSDEAALSSPVEFHRTKEASVTMRTLGPVDETLMENWVKQWAF